MIFNRESLIKALNYFVDEMLLPQDRPPEFGVMDASLAPMPAGYGEYAGATMSAVTKYFAGETDVEVLDAVIEEIKADIAWLRSTHGDLLMKYGMFFYKVPVEDTANMISFASVAEVMCDTSIGCRHARQVHRPS